MKKFGIGVALMVSMSLVAAAGVASAITIDCASAGCLGGVYTLDISSTGGNSYVATYTIDTTTAYSVNALYLNDIEFKVANSYTNASILSGPSGAALGGPLSGQGCKGNNGSFVCATLAPKVNVGSVYTWQIGFDSTAILAQKDWHVGARYTSDTKNSGWVISESPVAGVPEPGAALLFAAGLVVAGSATRRRA